MAVEIRVNPSYIGLQNNPDCTYKWSWYVWDRDYKGNRPQLDWILPDKCN